MKRLFLIYTLFIFQILIARSSVRLKNADYVEKQSAAIDSLLNTDSHSQTSDIDSMVNQIDRLSIQFYETGDYKNLKKIKGIVTLIDESKHELVIKNEEGNEARYFFGSYILSDLEAIFECMDVHPGDPINIYVIFDVIFFAKPIIFPVSILEYDKPFLYINSINTAERKVDVVCRYIYIPNTLFSIRVGDHSFPSDPSNKSISETFSININEEATSLSAIVELSDNRNIGSNLLYIPGEKNLHKMRFVNFKPGNLAVECITPDYKFEKVDISRFHYSLSPATKEVWNFGERIDSSNIYWNIEGNSGFFIDNNIDANTLRKYELKFTNVEHSGGPVIELFVFGWFDKDIGMVRPVIVDYQSFVVTPEMINDRLNIFKFDKGYNTDYITFIADSENYSEFVDVEISTNGTIHIGAYCFQKLIYPIKENSPVTVSDLFDNYYLIDSSIQKTVPNDRYAIIRLLMLINTYSQSSSSSTQINSSTINTMLKTNFLVPKKFIVAEKK